MKDFKLAAECIVKRAEDLPAQAQAHPNTYHIPYHIHPSDSIVEIKYETREREITFPPNFFIRGILLMKNFGKLEKKEGTEVPFCTFQVLLLDGQLPGDIFWRKFRLSSIRLWYFLPRSYAFRFHEVLSIRHMYEIQQVLCQYFLSGCSFNPQAFPFFKVKFSKSCDKKLDKKLCRNLYYETKPGNSSRNFRGKSQRKCKCQDIWPRNYANKFCQGEGGDVSKRPPRRYKKVSMQIYSSVFSECKFLLQSHPYIPLNSYERLLQTYFPSSGARSRGLIRVKIPAEIGV